MGHSRFAQQRECRIDDPQRGPEVRPIGADHGVPSPVVGPKQLIGTIEQVETHQPDPTSNESVDPWETASSDFSSLGDRLRDTYRRVASEGGPSEDELKNAFATLLGAWEQVAASLSTALNDPDTRAHLKRAAGSFAAALGATITDLGSEFEGKTPAHGEEAGDEPVDAGAVEGDRQAPSVT